MTDIPKYLLDLATEGVYIEEANNGQDNVTYIDGEHARPVATAALEPVLAELRQQVEEMSADSPETRSFRARVLHLLGGSDV